MTQWGELFKYQYFCDMWLRELSRRDTEVKAKQSHDFCHHVKVEVFLQARSSQTNIKNAADCRCDRLESQTSTPWP